MTTPFDATLGSPPLTRSGPAGELDTPTARAVLGYALGLGVAADSLLRNGPDGVAFSVWIALLLVSTVSLCWRTAQPIRREAAAWLFTAAVFSLGLAWRDSEILRVFDLFATAVALVAAAVTLSDQRWRLGAARAFDVIAASLAVARDTVAGIIPVALRAHLGMRAGRTEGRDLGVVARAVALSVVLLVVFGSLLLHADPIFASWFALPDIHLDVIISHVVLTGFFAWIVAGWTRSALSDRSSEHAVDTPPPFALRTLDVTMALGTLIVLFAAFVAAQGAWFFGGESYLREHTGLTASAYARRGFFDLVWVTILLIPVLMVTRAAIARDAAARRRHTVLAIPLVILLGVMMLSAVMHMRLYVRYFGLTTDRFYPLVFMGWLALVLVWLTMTVLRDHGRAFIGGAIISGLATLAALNLVNPDAIVARVNVNRAVAGAAPDSVDLAYLAHLGGDAAETSVAAVIDGRVGNAAQRCAAATRLLKVWGPESYAARRAAAPAAWRTWNAGTARGLRTVGANAGALGGVAHATCPPTVSQR